VIITKYNKHGDLLWQNTFNGTGDGDDYGVQVLVNDANEILVASAISETSGFDFGLLKYAPDGTLIYSSTWNGTSNGIDIPADLSIDGSGNTYLVGGTQASNGFLDYAMVKFNASGNVVWSSSYDHTNLHDAATSLKVDGTSMIVTGASASTPTDWDYATLKVNTSNGNIDDEERTTVPGVGLDNAVAVTTDDNNNIYVTGYVEVNGEKNIQTVKINGSFGLEWIKTFDGGLEDVAKSIGVDDFGNVYIAGYSEKPNGGKDFVTIKYDTNGNEQWVKEFGSGGGIHTAKAEKLAVTENGEVIVTGSIAKEADKDFATVKYDADGDMKFVKEFDNNSEDDEAESIVVKGDNIYVSGTSKENGVKKNATVKYSTKEKPIVIATDSEGHKYVQNELLIRFDPDALYHDAIDKKDFTAGELSDFVKPDVLAEMNQVTEFTWDKLKTFKIFLRMTTADTTSITRLGEEIRIDDHWATLSVILDNGMNEQTVADQLNEMYPTIRYAERDFVGELFAIPDDPMFVQNQTGLYNGQHGIEVDEAWDRQVGQPYTKVGVYDSGINWRHEDYGDGTQSGTKIVGGWDFYDNASPFNQGTPDQNGHGTAVAGIIGALRNNNKGIAGIAGGDAQVGNSGCQLFSMALAVDVPLTPQQVVNVLHAQAGPAIVEGAVWNGNFGYGLHVQNHSWGSPYSSLTLRNAVKECYRNSCVFVVSSGNDGDATINYPATYPDDWVLKVGANDADGDEAYFSTIGNSLDVIAPGTNDIYASLDHNSNTTYTYNGNGTSFASPHVAGVVALMHSQHNINDGYPNDLAPEDVEVFLQSFRTDVPPAGYDPETGYGRVDADWVLERLTLPQYQVKHAGGQSANPLQTTATGMQVVVSGNMNGVAAGSYWADRYQVTNTFIDIFDPGQEVISDWVRNSSSIGVSAANPITGETYFDYSPTINQNVAAVTTTTFCWHITTTLLGQTINKWIPAQPHQLRTAYSLYVRDNVNTGIEDQELTEQLKLYPNPTNGQLSFEFSVSEPTDVQLEVLDATGRSVAEHNMGKQKAGLQVLNLNLSHLSTGAYTCRLVMNEKILTKRVIKH
jgi:subtilisin family serine protease